MAFLDGPRSETQTNHNFKHPIRRDEYVGAAIAGTRRTGGLRYHKVAGVLGNVRVLGEPPPPLNHKACPPRWIPLKKSGAKLLKPHFLNPLYLNPFPAGY